MVVGLLLSGCLLAQVKRTNFLIRHTKIVCILLHFCSIKIAAGRVEVGFVNLSHLVWALVIVMLAGRKREGHGDKPKKTHLRWGRPGCLSGRSVWDCVWASCTSEPRVAAAADACHPPLWPSHPETGRSLYHPRPWERHRFAFRQHRMNTRRGLSVLALYSRDQLIRAEQKWSCRCDTSSDCLFASVSWVGSVCVTQHNCWATNLMFSVTLWIVCSEFLSTGLVRSLGDPASKQWPKLEWIITNPHVLSNHCNNMGLTKCFC